MRIRNTNFTEALDVIQKEAQSVSTRTCRCLTILRITAAQEELHASDGDAKVCKSKQCRNRHDAKNHDEQHEDRQEIAHKVNNRSHKTAVCKHHVGANQVRGFFRLRLLAVEVAILHVMIEDCRRRRQLLVTGKFQAPALKEERSNTLNNKGEHQNDTQVDHQFRTLRVAEDIGKYSQITGKFRTHRNIHNGKDGCNTDHFHQRQEEQTD